MTTSTLTKPDMVKSLAQKTGMTQVKSAEVIDAVFELLFEFFENKGKSLRLGLLGTLKLVPRAARSIRNIHTGDKQDHPAHYTLKFTLAPEAKKMIRQVNGEPTVTDEDDDE